MKQDRLARKQSVKERLWLEHRPPSHKSPVEKGEEEEGRKRERPCQNNLLCMQAGPEEGRRALHLGSSVGAE